MAAALISGLSGCGASPASSASPPNAQRNAAATGSPVDQSTVVEPQNNSLPANNAMGARRKMVEVPANGEAPPPPAMPAPENSTITTTMASDGSFIEIRVFAGDHDIDRVKKISKDGNETVTIFLKNGRSVKAAAGRIPSTKTISLAALRAIAGIAPKLTTKPSERSEKGSVKPQP